MSYANVAATLALVLSTSGGALAARHYLINSTAQISPRVLHGLRAHRGRKGRGGKGGHNGKNGRNGKKGATGPTGPKGATGPQGLIGPPGSPGTPGRSGGTGAMGAVGATGATGPAEQPQKALAFNVALEGPAALGGHKEEFLFALAGEIQAKFSCLGFENEHGEHTIIAAILALAPAGSHAQVGVVAANSNNQPPQEAQELVKRTELSTEGEGEPIALLISNPTAPKANIGHVSGSITTPNAAAFIDAFVEAGPGPAGCKVQGTAFAIPL